MATRKKKTSDTAVAESEAPDTSHAEREDADEPRPVAVIKMKHPYQYAGAGPDECSECGFAEEDHDPSLAADNEIAAGATVTAYATDADGEQVAVDAPAPPRAPML